MRIFGMDQDTAITVFVILILLLLLSIIPGRIADNKGYSFAGFYLFSLFGGFIPALVVSIVLPEYVGRRATELASYKKLLDDGVITQEEFDKKKKELLG